MKSLTVFLEKESYFHKFQFSYVILISIISCKVQAYCNVTRHLRLWPEFLKFDPPDPKSWIRHCIWGLDLGRGCIDRVRSLALLARETTGKTNFDDVNSEFARVSQKGGLVFCKN